MQRLSPKLEIVLVALLLTIGAAFLLKMCYLSLTLNTAFGLFFLSCVYAYARFRHGLRIPVALLALVFLALQVDALGNYFRMYGRAIGPMQYDEFSHLSVQILITPTVIWLLHGSLAKFNYRLPLWLSSLFAVAIMFSLSAFYEMIELWDELYFSGQRIWSKYDTATDLQWDLCGILIGAGLANLVLRLSPQGTQQLKPVMPHS